MTDAGKIEGSLERPGYRAIAYPAAQDASRRGPHHAGGGGRPSARRPGFRRLHEDRRNLRAARPDRRRQAGPLRQLRPRPVSGGIFHAGREGRPLRPAPPQPHADHGQQTRRRRRPLRPRGRPAARHRRYLRLRLRPGARPDRGFVFSYAPHANPQLSPAPAALVRLVPGQGAEGDRLRLPQPARLVQRPGRRDLLHR